MTAYDDIYMRDYPGDTGVYPSANRIVSASPDIIPAGVNPVPNYETYYANNYNGPYNYYDNLEAGSFNYLYVRGKNLAAGAQTGKIYLYYSPSSLLLRPSNWINNQIQNSNETLFANVSASSNGQVCVGDAPFYWSPPPLQPGEGHYCLIARVVTEEDPDPIPSDDNLNDFALWVREHPGIAWRNMSLVDNIPGPDFTSMTGVENPEPNENLVTVVATCTNIPIGTTVSIVSTVTGPNPPINQSGTVDNTQKYLVSAVTELPANYKGKVELTANLPPGVSPPLGANIEVSYYLNQDSSTPTAKKIGIDPSEFGLTSEDIGFTSGGVMLLLGDYTYVFEMS